MITTINNGIIDNDPKGETGRGTKFYMEISVIELGAEPTKERHEYFLLDLLENKIDLAEIKRPYLERQAKFDVEQSNLEKKRKQEEKQQRNDSVQSTPELEKLIDDAIKTFPKAISEYKSGKEKALNVIIGSIMKEIKTKNIRVLDAAFTVTTLLKKKC